MREPVWVYRMGCLGWLGLIIVIAVLGAMIIAAFALVVGYFLTYAVVSGVANLISGPDPEPSPGFLDRLAASSDSQE